PKAEDPMGLQRPIDREEDTAAEEFADLVSELTEARLISTPGQSKEVLLSDDAPDKRSQVKPPSSTGAVTELVYPEWDYRQEAYRQSGTKRSEERRVGKSEDRGSGRNTSKKNECSTD